MKKQENYYPCALTISASDSGGGAGIQADLRTFSAIGVYGCSAVTAVISGNPAKVIKTDIMPPETAASQMEAVFSCFKIAAIKTGILANAETVKAVADILKKNAAGIPLVVDPVLFYSNNRRVLEKKAEKVLKDELFPLASWITIGTREAEILLGRHLPDQESKIKAACYIAGEWSCSCFLKTFSGNILEENVDIVIHKKRLYTVATPAIVNTKTLHGADCTLSGAIAGLIASGNNWQDCICEAKAFVYGSVLEAALVGHKCEAMYPPLENYRALVAISEIREKK